MSFSWNGVFPALTTPFTADDQLDLDLFEKNLLAQQEAGVKGVIIGGSLGEASTLELHETEQLTKRALAVVNGAIPVLVNVAECSTKNAVNAAKAAQEWGADGLMLLPPMRYKSSPDETVTYFKTVAAAVDLPILLYNNPYDYKIEITLAMFDQLVDVPNIEAVKESTRDVTNVTRMKNRFGDRFKVLCGVDTLTLEELAAGADGLVAGLVDALPAETVAIYNLAKAGQFDEARKIYRWFMPLLEFDIDPQLVQYIKLVSLFTGIGNEYVRAPRLPLSGKVREDAVKIIEAALACKPVLPEYLSLV
ncbi:MAG: dihydrodipicolinate synthase family protein [Chitinophagaceae bacterium]